jgi:Xaa-Pro aminopeptidase
MPQELDLHKTAVKKLETIRDRTFRYIQENIGKATEYEVQQFILAEFRKNGLIGDKDDPIVAVNKNTSVIHYFPKKNSETITKDSLILIDIWGRLREQESYLGDMTWMAYTGKEIPKEIQEMFKKVISARDKGINFIRDSLNKKIIPKCADIDNVVRESFGELKDKFKHTTGHSIGLENCHGGHFVVGKYCDKEILINIPFTIEPGLYLENQFGFRSEIDCYINENYELVITSEIQDEIFMI